ncbi:MAG: ribonuclease HII [Flavobacteriia bacterium]|nr:ribonuclease HII [Flavobacteriia bacterium]
MLKAFHSKGLTEAGCDEAGRGCLAGPVVAGAVILPNGFKNEFLNDSKKLTEKSRNHLREVIEREAISYGVGIVEPQKIDEINILNASFLAMHLALKKLKPQPKFIAVDGNRFNPYGKTPFECVVKGDGKVLNIAAASVLAKTYRDEIMESLDQKYPNYHWAKNKGYPTKKHREAIAKSGATPHHRMSFQLLPNQLKLQL